MFTLHGVIKFSYSSSLFLIRYIRTTISTITKIIKTNTFGNPKSAKFILIIGNRQKNGFDSSNHHYLQPIFNMLKSFRINQGNCPAFKEPHIIVMLEISCIISMTFYHPKQDRKAEGDSNYWVWKKEWAKLSCQLTKFHRKAYGKNNYCPCSCQSNSLVCACSFVCWLISNFIQYNLTIFWKTS